MVPNSPIDSHIHIGAEDRMEDLLGYRRILDLSMVGLLSLPTAGVGEEGNETINFNPEVLAAAALIRREAPTCRVVAYGSLDNRALLELDGLSRSDWDPAAQVRTLAGAGFNGLKLWEGKPDLQAALGITLADERLLECYREAGSRGMPVLVHVADPPLFWEASDTPWSYRGRGVPSYEELLRQAAAIAAAVPATTFIFPHLLFLAEDLPRLDAFLEAAPNALVDLAPGNYLYPALGGVPVTRSSRNLEAAARTAQEARSFFVRRRDRILMGSDAFFFSRRSAVLPGTSLEENLERYLRLHRFLTSDLSFGNPYANTPDRPMITGLALPPEVAGALLLENGRRLFGAAPAASAPAVSAAAYLDIWARGPRGRSDDAERRARAARARIEEASR